MTTESAYNLEEWGVATTTGRHIFNYNYRMTRTDLKGWELVNTVEAESEPGVTEKIYVWEKVGSKGQELARVCISEHDDWRTAQAQLRKHLLHSMRTNIPRGSGKLAALGDVNFVGQPNGSRVVAATFFTRGNVTVTVSSAGNKTVVDVSKIASMLDRSLSEPPEQQKIKTGLAERLAPKSVKVKKQGTATVIEKLPEPVPRSGWLKIVAPDGELRREGDSVIYLSPQAGEKRIRQYRVVQ